jgi:hypothetical protein
LDYGLLKTFVDISYAEGISLRSPWSPRSGAPWEISVILIVYAEGVTHFGVERARGPQTRHE